MSPEEIASKLAGMDARLKSNTHRIDALEKVVESVHDLASSVKVMAEKLTNMQGDINRVSEQVDNLAAVPGKRWESVVMDVTKLIIAAAVGYAIKSIGF